MFNFKMHAMPEIRYVYRLYNAYSVFGASHQRVQMKKNIGTNELFATFGAHGMSA